MGDAFSSYVDTIGTYLGASVPALLVVVVVDLIILALLIWRLIVCVREYSSYATHRDERLRRVRSQVAGLTSSLDTVDGHLSEAKSVVDRAYSASTSSRSVRCDFHSATVDLSSTRKELSNLTSALTSAQDEQSTLTALDHDLEVEHSRLCAVKEKKLVEVLKKRITTTTLSRDCASLDITDLTSTLAQHQTTLQSLQQVTTELQTKLKQTKTTHETQMSLLSRNLHTTTDRISYLTASHPTQLKAVIDQLNIDKDELFARVEKSKLKKKLFGMRRDDVVSTTTFFEEQVKEALVANPGAKERGKRLLELQKEKEELKGLMSVVMEQSKALFGIERKILRQKKIQVARLVHEICPLDEGLMDGLVRAPRAELEEDELRLTVSPRPCKIRLASGAPSNLVIETKAINLGRVQDSRILFYEDLQFLPISMQGALLAQRKDIEDSRTLSVLLGRIVTKRELEIFIKTAARYASIPSHEALLRFFIVPFPGRMGITHDVCEYGTLKDFVQYNTDFPLTRRLFIMYQVAIGMQMLYSVDERLASSVPWCTSAVLLTEKLVPKIILHSRLLELINITKITIREKCIYSPPEYLMGQMHGTKSVVYTLAAMTYEVLTGNVEAFKTVSDALLKDPDQRPDLSCFEELADADEDGTSRRWIADFLRRCWTTDYEARMSLSEAIEILRIGVIGEREQDQSVKLKVEIIDSAVTRRRKMKRRSLIAAIAAVDPKSAANVSGSAAAAAAMGAPRPRRAGRNRRSARAADPEAAAADADAAPGALSRGLKRLSRAFGGRTRRAGGAGHSYHKLELHDMTEDERELFQLSFLQPSTRAKHTMGFLRNLIGLLQDQIEVIPYDDVNLVQFLAHSPAGDVYAGRWKEHYVAFKTFNLTGASGDSDLTRFENEIRVCLRAQHEHVLPLLGAVVEHDHLGMLYEFCPYGNLHHFINTHPLFPWEKRWRILTEIADGMAYLHSQNIIHRDLTCRNVLLDTKLNARIADFGMSKLVQRMSMAKTRGVGTRLYQAPELYRGEDYTEKVDVFSFGILAYQVMTGIWKVYGEDDVSKQFVNPEFRPNLNVVNPRWMRALLGVCWAHRPHERPTFAGVLQVMNRNSPKKVYRKPIVVYMRLPGAEEASEEDEDMLLDEFTIRGLRDVAEEWSGVDSSSLSSITFEGQEITRKEQVEELESGCHLVVAIRN